MKKWITYALGILLTLVVLAGVGLAGYRMGLMQGASGERIVSGRPPELGRPPILEKRFDAGGPGFEWDKGPGRFAPGHEYARGGRRFRSPFFGLIQLLSVGLLIWLGYVLYRNSGWQFVRVNADSGPEAASPEKKPRGKTKS